MIIWIFPESLRSPSPSPSPSPFSLLKVPIAVTTLHVLLVLKLFFWWNQEKPGGGLSLFLEITKTETSLSVWVLGRPFKLANFFFLRAVHKSWPRPKHLPNRPDESQSMSVSSNGHLVLKISFQLKLNLLVYNTRACTRQLLEKIKQSFSLFFFFELQQENHNSSTNASHLIFFHFKCQSTISIYVLGKWKRSV